MPVDPFITWLWLIARTLLLPLAVGLTVSVVIYRQGVRLSRRRRRRARLLAAPRKESRPDPILADGRHERRTAARRAGSSVEILVSDAAVQVAVVRGQIVDRSTGGLALDLVIEGDVDLGTVLSVRSPHMPVNLP